MIEPKIRMRCMGCRASITYAARWEGRRARCPKCGTILKLAREAGRPSDETCNLPTDGATQDVKRYRDTKQSQLAPGKAWGFGKYKLLRRIGRGGFGEVWEAIDTHLGRRLAIKLPIFPSEATEKLQRFLREGRAAAQLRHPNIVGVLDAGEIEGKYFLATEFVTGQSLYDYGSDKQLSHRESAALIAKVARAVAYAHSHKIIHRDIKPHNIVVRSDGEPQLLDFGLAKQLHIDAGMTVDGALLGTPAYMAPEQARGELSQIGPASDQYSLGATLYWLLTGKPMFEGPTTAVLAKVAAARAKRPSQVIDGLDPRLDAICAKATSRLPEDRYANCAAFAADLERFLRDEIVLARPVGLWGRAERWARHNRLDAALIAAALTFVLLGLFVSLMGWWSSRSYVRLATDAELAAEKSLSEVKETQLQLQAELDRLAEAKRRAEAAQSEHAKSQALAEQNTAQLKEAIAQNQQLESEARRQLEIVQQSTTKTEEVIAQTVQTELSLRETFPTDFLHTVYLQANEAIQAENWEEARSQLDRVLPDNRGWLWAVAVHCVRSTERAATGKGRLRVTFLRRP